MPRFRLNYPFNRESRAVSEELHSTISECYACPVSHIHSHPMTRNPVHINLSEIMWPCNSQTTLTWELLAILAENSVTYFCFHRALEIQHKWKVHALSFWLCPWLTTALQCYLIFKSLSSHFISTLDTLWNDITSLSMSYNRVWHHLPYGWIQKLFAHIPEQIFPGAQMHLIY